MKSQEDIIDNIVLKMASVELGLGSLLHFFRVPFSGHFLSLLQGYFLIKAGRLLREFPNIAIEISWMVSLLKSLAPVGKKLGPLLSILMQGILFWIGSWIGPSKRSGEILGMILLSLWAFIQPLITFYIMFGAEFSKIGLYYLEKFSGEFPWAGNVLIVFVGLLIFIKICLACAIPFLELDATLEKVLKRPRTARVKMGMKFPVLTILIFLLAFIFWFHAETEYSRIIWLSLRPISVGLLFFVVANWSLSGKFILKIIWRLPFARAKYRRLRKIRTKIYSNSLQSSEG